MDNVFYEFTKYSAYVLSLILGALMPLIWGLVISYLLSPLASWFEEKLHSRKLALLMTYLLVLLSVSAVIYGFIVLIIGALPSGNIASVTEEIKNYFVDAFASAKSIIPDDISAVLGSWLEKKLSLGYMLEMLRSFTGGLAGFGAGLIASVYLLNDREYFGGLWEKAITLLLPQRTCGIIAETICEINQVILTFIKGAFVDGLIIAFLSSAVLTLLHVDYAVMIGILGGILNIIPYFGPFFSMLPAFLTSFISGGLAHGIVAVLGLFAVQQIDSNIIYPRIVGTSTGLHPLFVLLSVSISGYFWGIAGMLLAVPCASIIRILIIKWAYSR